MPADRAKPALVVTVLGGAALVAAFALGGLLAALVTGLCVVALAGFVLGHTGAGVALVAVAAALAAFTLTGLDGVGSSSDRPRRSSDLEAQLREARTRLRREASAVKAARDREMALRRRLGELRRRLATARSRSRTGDRRVPRAGAGRSRAPERRKRPARR